LASVSSITAGKGDENIRAAAKIMDLVSEKPSDDSMSPSGREIVEGSAESPADASGIFETPADNDFLTLTSTFAPFDIIIAIILLHDCRP
jgi:hypothetical protein